MPLLRILLAVTLAAGFVAVRAWGQAPEAGPAVAEAAAADVLRAGGSVPPATAGVAGPDVFFLPDASGKLRRVLGYQYEDFFQSWRAAQAQQQQARPPAYVLDSLIATANADGESVAVKVVLDVELQSTDWVEAPLQMAGLIMDEWKIEGEKDSRDFLLFDQVRQGYVAWLKGTPGERREITLTGQLLVQRDGEGRQLEIELPTAAESHVDFTAASQVEVESPPLAVHTTVTADDGRYTSQIEGAKGRLALRWGPRPVEEFDRAATLSSSVDATITVEPGRIAYEAAVTLRSFGEPLDRVRIRLPRGATAAALPAGAGYELIPIASTAARNGAALVEVRFEQPSTTPPPVRLVAEQSSSGDAAAPLRAAPFEVVGAFRERSQVAVRVSELLHADFHGEGRIQQIDPLELPEPLRTPAPLAAFAGAGADWRLEVDTQPRQRKVRATPTYALDLGSQGATLDVTLDYQFLGGRTFELRADLRGWELAEQPIESGGVVDLAEQHVTPAGVLIMPLKESNLQQARVRFTLRREAGLGLHELPLPELLDAYTLPGTLTVDCDDAWRAVVQVENSSGIASTDGGQAVAPAAAEAAAAGGASGAATVVLPAPRRDLGLHRFQTFLARARVAVDVSEQEQLITASSIVEGSINGKLLEVDQKIQYDVAYQPASELSTTVAADLLSNQGLQLLLDGKPLTSAELDVKPLGTASPGAADGTMRLVVLFARPRLGRAELQIRSIYHLSAAELAGQAKISVPLVTPAQPASSRLRVTAPAGQANVTLWGEGQADPWRTVAPEATGVGGDQQPSLFEASAAKPVSELALRLEEISKVERNDLRVEANWVQTWIVGGQRQDRYAYRFRTSASQVKLRLPEDLVGTPLEVKLDGAPIPVDVAGELLTAALPTAESAQSHTLELRRHAPQQLAATTAIAANFPKMEGAQGSSPFYWQLVVPREMAVIATPLGLNGEYRLGWRDWSWGRQPTQTQADLEAWTNASTAQKLPASTNEYLYSAFDAPAEAGVRLVRRAWLIIAAGAGALAVGLVALYTNLGRTAGFWLAAIIAAVGTLVAYPEASVLLVQAIFLGGAFTIVSLATKWLLTDVRIRRSSQAAPPSSIASLTATQPWLADRQQESDVVIAASGSTRQIRETTP